MRTISLAALVLVALLTAPVLAQPAPDSACGVVGKVLRTAIKSGAIARVCTTTHFANDHLLLKVRVSLVDRKRLAVDVVHEWKDRLSSTPTLTFEVGLDGRVQTWGEKGLYAGGLLRLPDGRTILRWSDRYLISDVASFVLARLADQGLPAQSTYWRLSSHAGSCGDLGVIRKVKEGLELGHPDRPMRIHVGADHQIKAIFYPSNRGSDDRRGTPLKPLSAEAYAKVRAAWRDLPSPRYGISGAYGVGGGSRGPQPVGEALLKPWRVALRRVAGTAPLEVSGSKSRRGVELHAKHKAWTLGRWIAKDSSNVRRLPSRLLQRVFPLLKTGKAAETPWQIHERRAGHVVELEAAQLRTPRRLLDAAWGGVAGGGETSEQLTLRRSGEELTTFQGVSEVESPLPQALLRLLFELRSAGTITLGDLSAKPTKLSWVDPEVSDRGRFVFAQGVVLEIVAAEGGGYLACARSEKALKALQETYARLSGKHGLPFAVGHASKESAAPR